MKKVVSLLSALVLSLTCATAVNADYINSATYDGGASVSNGGVLTTKNGETVKASITTTAETESLYAEFASVDKDVEKFIDTFDEKDAEAVKAAIGEKGLAISQLSPRALVDISLDVTLDGDSVDIPVKLPGVTDGAKAVAIHFMDNGSIEALPTSDVENGTVTITMTSFSPVMILVEDVNAGAGTSNNGSTGTSEKTETGVYSNVALWAGVLVVAVAAAGIVLYDRKKKAN